jgi:hypothetical protein
MTPRDVGIMALVARSIIRDRSANCDGCQDDTRRPNR